MSGPKTTNRAAVSTALVMLTAMSARVDAGTRIPNHARKGSGFVVDSRLWHSHASARVTCVVRIELARTTRPELPPPTVASVLLRSLEPPRIDHPRSPDEEALGDAVVVCMDSIAALSLALPVMLDQMFGGAGAARSLAPVRVSTGGAP